MCPAVTVELAAVPCLCSEWSIRVSDTLESVVETENRAATHRDCRSQIPSAYAARDGLPQHLAVTGKLLNKRARGGRWEGRLRGLYAGDGIENDARSLVIIG